MNARTRLALITVPALVGIVLLLVSPAPQIVAGPLHPFGKAQLVPTAATFKGKIWHVVIVMMENHAYDNYYGVYCLQRAKYCSMKGNGESPTACINKVPGNASAGCIAPFTLTTLNWSISTPLPHSANSTMQAYDNGSMDGFFQAEKSGVDPFGHYNGHSIPLYYDMAEEYGLGDNFFSSDPSYSLPNHWHLVAGQSPAAVQWQLIRANQPWMVANRSTYLDEANRTQSIQDLLLNSSVSWKWYDHSLAPNYTASIRSLNGSQQAGTAFAYWNPQSAKAESYNSSFRHHYVNSTTFYADAARGSLPEVSWVIPPGNSSDHPPGSAGKAQSWLSSVVDSVEASPTWNSTAVFVTWDEYGGFYDHVAPPVALGTNLTLGFRVPMLVISPYAKENFINHNLGYFDSLLRLVENRFNLPCLTVFDCNAPSLANYFNFSQSPRPPIIFPAGPGLAIYPMPLQNATNFATWPSAPYQPPAGFATMPQNEMTFNTE